MISLKDCGADPSKDNRDAFMVALDKVAGVDDFSSNILIDGSFEIRTPVEYEFSGKSSSLSLVGEGSSCRLIPKTAPDKRMLSFANLNSFQARDFGITGTEALAIDTQCVLSLFNVESARLAHVDFYGVSCAHSGFGMLHFNRSNVKMEHCLIQGCGAATGRGIGLIENQGWFGFTMLDCEFKDYGELDQAGYLWKTSMGATSAWVRLGDSFLETPKAGFTAPLRPKFERVRMDEGAVLGIAVSPTNMLRGLDIDNIQVNVYGDKIAIYAENVADVRVVRSKFGWSEKMGDARALKTKNCPRVTLDSCVGTDGVHRLDHEGPLVEYNLINSPDFTIRYQDGKLVQQFSPKV